MKKAVSKSNNKIPVRRAIRINFKDGSYKDLELSTAVIIGFESDGKPGFIHFDQLIKTGDWRLTFNQSSVGRDFSEISNFEVIRS